MATQCPVMLIIDKIYAGGYEDDSAESYRIGGAGPEHTCDDIIYKRNLRLIEYARFQISDEDPAAFFERMFGPFRTESYGDLAWGLISESDIYFHLNKQYTGVVDLSDRLQRWLMARIRTMARNGSRTIGLSIGSAAPVLPDQLIVKNDNLISLYELTNKNIAWWRGLNIRSICVGCVYDFDMVDVAPPTIKVPANFSKKNISILADIGRTNYLVAKFIRNEPIGAPRKLWAEAAKRILDAELPAYEYAEKCERYQHQIISKLDEIFTRYNCIIAQVVKQEN